MYIVGWQERVLLDFKLTLWMINEIRQQNRKRNFIRDTSGRFIIISLHNTLRSRQKLLLFLNPISFPDKIYPKYHRLPPKEGGQTKITKQMIVLKS